jgi:23S rRNA pseudouridine2605 synthase
MTVGRLDMNTEGLLLLTNDGGLARVLELPQTGWLRRYRVRVHGEVDEAALAGLSKGIAVEGVYYGAIDAVLDRRQGTNAWLTLGLREGKNREVRNVLGALGLEVTRLIRISYGPFQLGELPERAVLELKGRTLRDQLGQRLIEESGADFEAPVATAFSNKPVAAETRKPRQPAVPEAGEGGLIKGRRLDRQDRRDAALGRLGTKKPMRGAPRSEKGEARDDKPAGRRNVNVWMAPGARPTGPKPMRKPDEELSDRPRPPRRARAESGEQATRTPRPRRERDEGAEPAKRPYRLGKAEREGRPYVPKGDARPFREKAEDGERKFSRPAKPHGEGRKFEGERPARAREDGDRKFSRPAKPRGEGGKFEGDRPPRVREDGERKFSRPAKPRGEGRKFEGDRPPRPREDGERKFSRPAKPRGEGRKFEGDRPPRPREDGERKFSRPAKPRSEGRNFDGDRPPRAREDGERKTARPERPQWKDRPPRPTSDRPNRDGPAGGKPRGPRKGGGNADRRR